MKRLVLVAILGVLGCSACITVAPCRCPGEDGKPLPPQNRNHVQQTSQPAEVNAR